LHILVHLLFRFLVTTTLNERKEMGHFRCKITTVRSTDNPYDELQVIYDNLMGASDFVDDAELPVLLKGHTRAKVAK